MRRAEACIYQREEKGTKAKPQRLLHRREVNEVYHPKFSTDKVTLFPVPARRARFVSTVSDVGPQTVPRNKDASGKEAVNSSLTLRSKKKVPGLTIHRNRSTLSIYKNSVEDLLEIRSSLHDSVDKRRRGGREFPLLLAQVVRLLVDRSVRGFFLARGVLLLDQNIVGQLLLGWNVCRSSDEQLEIEDEGRRAGGSKDLELFGDPGEVIW